MTNYGPPSSGQPIIPYVGNIAMWRDIVAMVGWWQKQQGSNAVVNGSGGITPIAINTAASAFLAGDLARISGPILQPTNPQPMPQQLNTPLIELAEPSWSNLSNIIIVHKPIPTDRSAPVVIPNLFAVKGELEKPTDTFAMMNPNNPRRMLSSDAGMFKIVAALVDRNDPNERYLIVDTRTSQPIWRFAIVGGSTRLYRLDGDLYANSISLSHPNGIVPQGFCLQTGAGFISLAPAFRRHWLGTLTYGYNGVVGGFWVTPTIALDGVLPTGAQWVQNIYKWDYGAPGAVIRVERDNLRWIPLQQEYSCPPDAPPIYPLGACAYYDPESGSTCAIMTQADCALQSGGTWTEGGTC